MRSGWQRQLAVIEKVRFGTTVAGALIGAVMKQMRVQATAAKVRELVNAKLGI